MRNLLPTVAVAAAALSTLAMTPRAHAAAVTLGFEGASYFSNPTTPVTESGFAYSTLSGSLLVNGFGNPGQDIEASVSNAGAGASGGVLQIASATAGGAFSFNGLDLAVLDGGTPTAGTVTVTGLRSGVAVGTASYTLTGSTAYAYTTEAAAGLAGLTVDTLDISLPGTFTSFNTFVYTAIDNVRLTTGGAAVPEPASMALLGSGLLGLGLARRRRRG